MKLGHEVGMIGCYHPNISAKGWVSTLHPASAAGGVASLWYGHFITLIVTAHFSPQFVLGLQWKPRPGNRVPSAGAFCDGSDEKVGRTAPIYSPRFINRITA